LATELIHYTNKVLLQWNYIFNCPDWRPNPG
jgi:hypothetical protein